MAYRLSRISTRTGDNGTTGLADGTRVRARVQGRVPVRAGDSISVSVDGTALFFADTP